MALLVGSAMVLPSGMFTFKPGAQVEVNILTKKIYIFLNDLSRLLVMLNY